MTPSDSAIGREAIRAAEKIIRPYIRKTPVVTVKASDFGLPFENPLTFKLEFLQHSGSFKARGAFANLLLREVPSAGVVAASGGNHGAAVAFAAKRLGIPARIYVPEVCSPAKIQRIRDSGAELVVGGKFYGEALEAAEAWAAKSGALKVHAFDQRETLLGQGTLALELEAQSPNLDTLLVSVGGGGLIGGIAAWYAGRIRLIGVEPEASPTLTRAFEKGEPVDAEVGGIAADSLAPRRVGEVLYPIVRKYVEGPILVADEEIKKAQSALWAALRVVAEPGGAAAFAALLSGRFTPAAGERLGAVVSGGNTIAVDFPRSW